MIYTNKYNIPAHIVEAIINDPYDSNPDPKFISATTLIASPRVRQLIKRFNESISVDVSKRLWSMFGSSGHSVLERISKKDRMMEERLYQRFPVCVDCGSITINLNELTCNKCQSKNVISYITGKMDFFDKKLKYLSDNKFTNMNSLIYAKEGWIIQLNIYKYLLNRAGYEVDKLSICAFLRDWSKYGKYNSKFSSIKYPEIAFKEIDIEIWDNDKIRNYIIERLSLHNACNNVPTEELPLCTDKERWYTKPIFAVYKNNGGKASKLCDTKELAEEYIALQKNKHKADLTDVFTIEERKGGDGKCCPDYCDACTVCDYWIKKYKNANDKENE